MTEQLPEQSPPEFSLIVPVRRPPELFRDHIRDIWAYFAEQGLLPFEIILVPNSAAKDDGDPSQGWCAELARELEGVRYAVHAGRPGKGSAIKTGVRASRGRYVFFTDADLPYSLHFFVEAASLLRAGTSLVVGNRRREESWFEVPVPLLPYVYSRHRLSLLFNRTVRLLLPIPFTDTQAGIKAMTRELAQVAFSRNICPGFFFDLEIFLTAHGLGMAMADLPVHFTQHDEVTTVRFAQSAVNALYWLARIKLRHLRGYYRWSPVGGEGSTAPVALHTR
jgi:dolichyl-phosphate beta-glucosyltransferase